MSRKAAIYDRLRGSAVVDTAMRCGKLVLRKCYLTTLDFFRRLVIAWWLIIAGMSPLLDARAQELIPGELIPGEPLQARFDRRQPPVGARIAGIWLQPVFRYDQAFDDNIFATSSGRRADTIMMVSGSLTADYATSPTAWRLTGTFLDQHYAVNTSENEWEGSVGGIFRREISNDAQLSAGGSVQRLIQGRSDPTGFGGVTPATFQVYNAFGGLVIGNPLSNQLDLKAGVTRLVYNPLQGTTGPIDTAQRNRTEIYAAPYFSHTFFGEQKAFAEIRPNVRNYDREFDDDGFKRSSAGVRAGIGGTLDFSSIVFVTLGTGFQLQNYYDPRFGKVTVPNGSVRISWWPTRLTNASVNFVHEYQEEFFADSPGSTRNLVVFQAAHELRRNLLLSASIALDFREVVAVDARLREQNASVKAQYQFADGFAIVADYTYARQQGTGGLGSYDKNLITMSLKKLF